MSPRALSASVGAHVLEDDGLRLERQQAPVLPRQGLGEPARCACRCRCRPRSPLPAQRQQSEQEPTSISQHSPTDDRLAEQASFGSTSIQPWRDAPACRAARRRCGWTERPVVRQPRRHAALDVGACGVRARLRRPGATMRTTIKVTATDIATAIEMATSETFSILVRRPRQRARSSIWCGGRLYSTGHRSDASDVGAPQPNLSVRFVILSATSP